MRHPVTRQYRIADRFRRSIIDGIDQCQWLNCHSYRWLMKQRGGGGGGR